MPNDVKGVLDSINGVLTSTAALVALVTPYAVKIWRWLTAHEANEKEQRVDAVLDRLDRIAETHVLAVEQTRAKGKRDDQGRLPNGLGDQIKDEAIRGVKETYGEDNWRATALKLGMSITQLNAHLDRTVEALVFKMRTTLPPPSENTLPAFGGMTENEKRAAGALP